MNRGRREIKGERQMDRRSKKRVWTACMVISGIAALWFGYSFFHTLWGYRQGEEDLERVYQIMESAEAETMPPPSSAAETTAAAAAAQAETEPETTESAAGTEPKETESSAPETEPEPAAIVRAAAEPAAEYSISMEGRSLEQYAALKEQNSDVIGWIRIEGTVIDYPVMYTPEDRDFYLHRGFDKESSAYGMIYMDGACNLETGGLNYLLYGHHMKNGSMFAKLENYKYQSYFEEHPVVVFDTLTEYAEYEVFGAISLSADDVSDEFLRDLLAQDEESYQRLVDTVKAESYYDTGITPVWPQQLLTLATCEYSQQNGRLMVFARKIKTEHE